MNTYCRKRIPSFILCITLIVAMAFLTTGCNGKNSSGSGTTGSSQEAASGKESGVLGEGSTQFTFTVVDQDGSETEFEIHTDKETVGEALQELDLIAGEESEYGLLVKTVNGITADYDKDGVYWAFYIDDEYAQTGVDSTEINEGSHYSFKVEKA